MANILVVGGSGFVSGTVARLALEQGHHVWTITRGQRPVPTGVNSLIADRKDEAAFEGVVAAANTRWDLVIDCIGFDPQDAAQDLAVFRDRAAHLVFVSTDFVYNPAQRHFPQPEEAESYLAEGYGQRKRQCELLLSQSDGVLPWTVIRPCHIYGPGSKLGCLPKHGRDDQLIERLRRGEALQLVGGGHFLQQPIFAPDLAALLLSVLGQSAVHGQIFNAAGPDIIESKTYYEIIAEVLGVGLTVEEVSVQQYLAEMPQHATFLCHRIYDLSRLAESGLHVPATPIATGLRQHIESILAA